MKRVACEVYSRVCGFYRPISEWNKAKKSEYKDRKEIDPKDLVRKIVKIDCDELLNLKDEECYDT